ncbi:MAG: hypothetical protein M0P14_00755 [Alkaliphilus sp.]|nr:hypothetical protein [Alkaliphilus sp.]
MKADRESTGYDCNACERSNCKGDFYRGKKSVTFVGCPGQVKLSPMRVSLLENAIEHPGSMASLGQIMLNLNMKFEETNKYPYFRFKLGPEPR